MAYPTYEQTFTTDIKVGDKTIKLEIGKFSEQVAAAVLATCGETVVHTTVALGGETNLDYFPLQVEYAEKLYAGGIIKGSRWVKREGRPSDDSILKARVIDRTIRPLFPEGLKNEIQIVNTVFSYDQENSDDMVALLATGVALAVSGIPFNGPVAGLRIGYRKETNQYLINPTETEQEALDLDLIVSGTGKTIVMVEAGANEVSEPVVIEGMMKAQQILGEVCEQITKFVQKVSRPSLDLVKLPSAEQTHRHTQIVEFLTKNHAAQIKEMVLKEAVLAPTGMAEFIAEIQPQLSEQVTAGETGVPPVSAGEIKGIIFELMKQEARRMILEDKIRPDQRKPDEIRPIWCEVDVFPRTHGSAMFKRGATQAVTITTLGSPSLGWHVEDMEGEEVRHYMHHYNMPPYASGEAGRIGSPKRREIGHGRLAERALLPMIPSQEQFPYTIRVVSEIVSSNGSTSQASICGSTLSLMAAGVPIKRPVAGIAMGLMSKSLEDYVILSDIQGLEDHVGDMDFKVAGTTEGITAIQMDIKLTGISVEILERALAQAKAGRLHILDKMLACLPAPRTELSKYAPKIEQITVPADRIGEIIGPSGKIIKQIIEVTGAQVDIEQEPGTTVGTVNISAVDQENITKARTMIENIIRVVEVGDEFDGSVTRIENYGAFVEYLPGREGLVHVSQMATGFVKDPNTIVQLGQTVHIRVSGFKEDGKVELSMLSAEEAAQAAAEAQARRSSRPAGNGFRDRNNDHGNGGYSRFSRDSRPPRR